MASKSRTTAVSAELLISTHSTPETAVFLFGTPKGPVELRIPRQELNDLIQAASKIRDEPPPVSHEPVQGEEPFDPGKIWAAKDSEHLVIHFITKAGDSKSFRFDRKHGLHVARLLMESVTTGGMPWGRGGG